MDMDKNNYKIVILSDRKVLEKHHVSYDTILEMENEFVQSKYIDMVCLKKGLSHINKIVYKLFKFRMPDIMYGTKELQQANIIMYIAMGIFDLERNLETLRRLSLKGKKIVIYCFDTWESQYDRWISMFDKINPRIIFFAYKQSACYFASKYNACYWIPQSMDKVYFYNDKEEKEITHLFMQMGRKTISIHNWIMDYLKENKLPDVPENYVYEREKGKIIYPKTENLADNIRKTKYFVCAPQIVDNSSVTGQISDVTARFYEAMACKTLIIGFKPDTFDCLFPEDAMVTLKKDGSDFFSIIDFYESHPEEYNRIVNRNYELLMERHTWSNRLESMIEIIEKECFK